jgi:hypothetical protein
MSTATHPVTPEELMALLDGELSADRAQSVSAHTESCADCQEVLSSLRSVAQQVSNWHVGAVPHLHLDADVTSAKKSAKTRSIRFLGWTGAIVTGLVIIFAISVPNLFRSRMAANSASAIGSLRAINTAAETYAQTYGHYPRSLKELGPSASGVRSENGAGLIDSVLADGQKSGYRYSYEPAPGSGYAVDAAPVQSGTTGVRHFSTDQTGVISANNVPLDGDTSPVATYSSQTSQAQDLALANRSYNELVSIAPAKPPAGAAHGEREIGKLRVNAKLQNAEQSVPVAPMIARTVSLAILVKDFDASRKSLDGILARYHGYAANLTASTPQGVGRSIQASLRIPAPQLAPALAELKALGHVENENQSGEEVTQQHADLVARLKNSRETEQRLQAILTQRTGKISDVLEVEQEIARVRGEIEQMEAEQKNLEHRVDFATVDLKISEEYKVQLDSSAPSFSTQFHNALVNGYRNVADTVAALLLFFAEYGPVLLLWAALLSIPAWLVWRRWRQVANPAV